MARYASEVVEVAKSWIGKKESDGSHMYIVNIYNKHEPLARNYKVKSTDSWCATFGSAVAIYLGYTSIIPTECSCGFQIDLWKKNGCWIEDDNHVPSAGEYIYYDWDDDGKGDCTGWPEHVGIVEKVVNGIITVIEGNKNNRVERREIKVGAKNIRGYGVPKYDAEPKKDTSKPATSSKPTASTKPTAKKIVAKDSAKSYNKSIAGTYKVTANSGLYLRTGAGVTKKSLVVLPKDTKVENYGYYTKVLGTNWLYVQVTLDGVQYTGFASSKYLKK